jgi:DNA-binding transcriptional MerR regulator
MRIGELAKRAGVSTKTIRYYEDIELLPEPARSANDYRDYGPEDVERLLFIRDAQATGLTLDEIGFILDIRGRGESTCAHVVDLLDAHLEELDRHIDELQRTRRHLAALTEHARTLDPTECTDPIWCQTIAASAEAKRPDRGSLGHRHDTPHAHAHR